MVVCCAVVWSAGSGFDSETAQAVLSFVGLWLGQWQFSIVLMLNYNLLLMRTFSALLVEAEISVKRKQNCHYQG